MGLADTAELVVALKLQDGLSSGLGRLNGQLKGMQGGLSQVGQGIGQVGRGLDTLATRGAIAAVGLGTAFITTAASMEEAFTGVQKTVDETNDVSFEELRQNLRRMSSDTGTAFEELSRIGEVGGALGVGIESLDEFIDVVNRLSVSTDLTADTAATALGQLGTTLHLSGEDFREFADVLVALGNAGASTEPQIVDLASRFAAAGNRAGLTSEEILALSSAVTSMGVEVEAGGTALSQTFNEIALAIGTGGEEVEAFTDLLGINAAEFRRRWEEDALGVFQEFLQEISKLPPIEQAVALEAAGITGTRQLSAIGLMADNYGFVADQLEIARSATGELGEESDKFFGTSAAGFRRLKENLRLTADTIGTELLPIVNELGSEFITWLQTPAVQAGIKDFAVDLADGIRGFVAEVKKADFGPLLETLKGAASIARGAFDAFNALPEPVKQLALAALVTNKVTGGAVFQIAGGLATIFGGALKTIHAAHVTVIGPGGGGPPTGPSRGPSRFPFIPVATALTLPLALSGSDNPSAEMSNRQIQLTDKLNEGLITSAEAAREWAEFYGETTNNPFREGFWTKFFTLARNPVPEGPPLPGFGIGALQGMIEEAKSRVPVLPDTALPVLTHIRETVDTLPDTSMLAPAVTALVTNLPAIRTDTKAAKTASDLQTSELVRNRAATVERLTTLAGKYDMTNARLDGANRQLGVIASKNAVHPVTVNNTITIPVSVSATLIEQRLVTARQAAVGVPTAPRIL